MTLRGKVTLLRSHNWEVTELELGDLLSCFPGLGPSHGRTAAPGGIMLRPTPAPTHTAGLAAWHSYCVSGIDVVLLGDATMAASALTHHRHV